MAILIKRTFKEKNPNFALYNDGYRTHAETLVILQEGEEFSNPAADYGFYGSSTNNTVINAGTIDGGAEAEIHLDEETRKRIREFLQKPIDTKQLEEGFVQEAPEMGFKIEIQDLAFNSENPKNTKFVEEVLSMEELKKFDVKFEECKFERGEFVPKLSSQTPSLTLYCCEYDKGALPSIFSKLPGGLKYLSVNGHDYEGHFSNDELLNFTLPPSLESVDFTNQQMSEEFISRFVSNTLPKLPNLQSFSFENNALRTPSTYESALWEIYNTKEDALNIKNAAQKLFTSKNLKKFVKTMLESLAVQPALVGVDILRASEIIFGFGDDRLDTAIKKVLQAPESERDNAIRQITSETLSTAGRPLSEITEDEKLRLQAIMESISLARFANIDDHLKTLLEGAKQLPKIIGKVEYAKTLQEVSTILFDNADRLQTAMGQTESLLASGIKPEAAAETVSTILKSEATNTMRRFETEAREEESLNNLREAISSVSSTIWTSSMQRTSGEILRALEENDHLKFSSSRTIFFSPSVLKLDPLRIYDINIRTSLEAMQAPQLFEGKMTKPSGDFSCAIHIEESEQYREGVFTLRYKNGETSIHRGWKHELEEDELESFGIFYEQGEVVVHENQPEEEIGKPVPPLNIFTNLITQFSQHVEACLAKEAQSAGNLRAEATLSTSTESSLAQSAGNEAAPSAHQPTTERRAATARGEFVPKAPGTVDQDAFAKTQLTEFAKYGRKPERAASTVKTRKPESADALAEQRKALRQGFDTSTQVQEQKPAKLSDRVKPQNKVGSDYVKKQNAAATAAAYGAPSQAPKANADKTKRATTATTRGEPTLA